jgi:hypothetical protein
MTRIPIIDDPPSTETENILELCQLMRQFLNHLSYPRQVKILNAIQSHGDMSFEELKLETRMSTVNLGSSLISVGSQVSLYTNSY